MIDHRTGRFTSSSIHKLIKSGRGKNDIFSAPGLTYIQEKNIEKKLGRSLGTDPQTKPILWGALMEKIVHQTYLSDSYTLISNDYRFHPTLGKYWSGIPDMEAPGEIAEIKCYQLKNFALYSECLMQKDIVCLRENFPQEYWQMVSNAIINNVPKATAVSYMPYKDELEEIRDAIENTGLLEKYEFNPWQFRYMVEDEIDYLPFIEKGGYFQNVTLFSFVVPEEDKKLLTERVKLAIELIDK